MKSLGQVHFHRILAEGNTSLTTNNNPLFYRFMPSLDTSSVYSWYCIHPSAGSAAWFSVSANGWGTTNYTIGTFPTGYKRYLWCHTYIRLVFDNIAENISIKVRFVRKGKAHSSSTTFFALPINPDEPIDQQYWHVLYEKKIVFDSPTSDTSAQHRELDYFFPWNRLIETSTKASSTALTDWMDNPYGPNNFLTMCIVSDDAGLTTDSQYVAVKCYMEHKFVEVD